MIRLPQLCTIIVIIFIIFFIFIERIDFGISCGIGFGFGIFSGIVLTSEKYNKRYREYYGKRRIKDI